MSIYTALEVEQRIIDAFDKNFRTQLGPAQAFFELPQRDGELVRVVYVVYSVMGNDIDSLHDWFFERVVDKLIEQTGGEGYLYWRNPERVLAYNSKATNLAGKVGDLFKIRTRLAVLDKGLNTVQLPNEITLEGAVASKP